MREDAGEQTTLDRVEDLRRDGRSLRGIGRALADEGRLNRDGRPFGASTVQRLVVAVERRRTDARACA